LPRAECLKRLQAAIASEFSVVTSLSVTGTIDGNNFRIRKTIYYRNSFQQHLFGSLSDVAGGGTRIHGEARELNLRWVFIAGVAIAMIGLLAMLVVLFQHRTELHAVPPVALLAIAAIVPLLVGIGLAAVAIGRRLARSESQFLVDFLKRTLDARAA
jgi:hypothetical protein